MLVMFFVWLTDVNICDKKVNKNEHGFRVGCGTVFGVMFRRICHVFLSFLGGLFHTYDVFDLSYACGAISMVLRIPGSDNYGKTCVK